MTVASHDGYAATAAVPDELESAEAKLVYLSLKTAEGASVDELRDNVGLSKLTLHSILRTLRDRGVVRENDGEYRPAIEAQ